MRQKFVGGLTAVLVFAGAAFCGAQSPEPGWSPNVIVSERDREVLERTDIRERPYRPLHFYGNTVRRMYYRGNPLPTVRDMAITTRNLMPPRPASLSGPAMPGY